MLDNFVHEMDEFFDEDGYPTEHALDMIAKWDWRHTDECFQFVRQMWQWRKQMWTQTDNGEKVIYDISTGGWSGNESLVMALQENHVMWMFTWVQSKRGGHYIFELPYKKQPFMIGNRESAAKGLTQRVMDAVNEEPTHETLPPIGAALDKKEYIHWDPEAYVEVEEKMENNNIIHELEFLVNKYSFDAKTNTPDYILAEYLYECLMNYVEVTWKNDIHRKASDENTNDNN